MSRPSNALWVLFAVALARTAAAQTFPPADGWVPLSCAAGAMTDPANDTANAAGALDLVGVETAPAGLHAADATFLYLRMRVAGSPLTGMKLNGNAWGWEIDLDGDRTKYELLFSVSGVGGIEQVAVFRHPTSAVADDPADPAALPAAFTYPVASHARVTSAGSNLGGANDYYIDVALPWSDLATLGVARGTAVYIWAGSSTVPNALDLDLACATGVARLSQIDVVRTTPDPLPANTNPDGGVDGAVVGPRTLEGGPGCAFSGGRPELSALFWTLLLWGLSRRRARPSA